MSNSRERLAPSDVPKSRYRLASSDMPNSRDELAPSYMPNSTLEWDDRLDPHENFLTLVNRFKLPFISISVTYIYYKFVLKLALQDSITILLFIFLQWCCLCLGCLFYKLA